MTRGRVGPPVGMGANPGGVGNSSKSIGFPALCALMASSYCFWIRPIRRALLELPSCCACSEADLYFSNRCCKASMTVEGGGGAWNAAAVAFSPKTDSSILSIDCGGEVGDVVAVVVGVVAGVLRVGNDNDGILDKSTS